MLQNSDNFQKNSRIFKKTQGFLKKTQAKQEKTQRFGGSILIHPPKNRQKKACNLMASDKCFKSLNQAFYFGAFPFQITASFQRFQLARLLRPHPDGEAALLPRLERAGQQRVRRGGAAAAAFPSFILA